jgi:hypothetical protein
MTNVFLKILASNYKWVQTSAKHLVLPLALLPCLLAFQLGVLETHQILELSNTTPQPSLKAT